MDDLIGSFVQQIPCSGFELRSFRAVNLEQVSVAETVGKALYWPIDELGDRSYRPINEEPALFHKFADLNQAPPPQEILSFADEYGWLGIGIPAIDAAEDYRDLRDSTRSVVTCEFVEDWHEQLAKFVPYHQLWMAVVNQDEETLRSVITWHANFSAVSFQYQSTIYMPIASATQNQHLFSTLTRGDLFAPAKMVVARAINQNLSQLCSPALNFESSASGDARLRFRCENLLAVIWLQFATTVAENSSVRRCVQCNSPFIPSQSERGKKKRFCTDACKSKNYRTVGVRQS